MVGSWLGGYQVSVETTRVEEGQLAKTRSVYIFGRTGCSTRSDFLCVSESVQQIGLKIRQHLDRVACFGAKIVTITDRRTSSVLLCEANEPSFF
jgi:hypothetical protein